MVSDNLFQLIKSLDKSEKGYFKKFAGRHVIGKENNYVRLFDAIDNQKTYDENKLKKQFTKQFHVAKNYLYNLVLKSMRMYHAESSGKRKIRKLLDFADFLYEKDLNDQCKTIIRRAKKLALYYQNHDLLVTINGWEEILLFPEARKVSALNEITEDLPKEQQVYFSKLLNLSHYRLLNFRMYHIQSKIGIAIRNKKQRSEIELFEVDLRTWESNTPPITQEAKFLLYIAQMGMAAYSTDKPKLTQLKNKIKKEIVRLKTTPEIMHEYPTFYLRFMHHYAGLSFKLGLIPEVLKTTAEVKLFIQESKRNSIKAMAFTSVYYLESYVYVSTGRFQEGIAIADEIEKGLKTYHGLIHSGNKVNIIGSTMLSYFWCGEYKKALFWINKVLNDPDVGYNDQNFLYIRMLNLLIHYELQNTELLLHLLKSTERALKKRKLLFKTEITIIAFLKRAIIMPHKERKDAYLTLQRELEHLAKEKYEKQALTYFDYRQWVKEKNTALKK